MISARNSWLVAFALGLSFVEAHATEPFLGPELEAKIDAAAQRAVNGKKTAGVAVGVVRGGQLVFNRGYGLANVELNVPVNTSTVFRLASLTKQFVAADVLTLIDQKKLSLDDKLSKFYPDFPRAGEVTIRHLLTHTSGIRDYTEVRLEELGLRQWESCGRSSSTSPNSASTSIPARTGTTATRATTCSARSSKPFPASPWPRSRASACTAGSG